jgi:MYXO-CTERM domain-containing protein
MSSPTDPASAGSASSDPAELRRSIEETRGELADTVNALAAKADVKSRAQDKTKQLKAQAANKAREIRAQAMAKAPQLIGLAQQKSQQVQQVVQDKPGAVVGAALAVLGLLILRRRRRRRGKEDS